MKSIQEYIKELQEIELKYPEAIVVAPGHSDGNGYFSADGTPEVLTLVYYPGYSWSGAGHLFPDENYKSFEGKPRFTAVVLS